MALVAAAVLTMAAAPAAPIAAIAPAGPVVMHDSEGAARLTITIAPGYHIQSNHPSLDYLIASSVTLTPVAGISAGTPQWPPPLHRKFGFAPDSLDVFAGTITVVVPLHAAGVAAGRHVLQGVLHYQACTDQMCRAPATVPFRVVVEVR